MKKIKKEYSNKDITVIWQPHLCIHSGICIRNLPEVFDTSKRPWINIEGANTGRIISQVEACPSKALSYVKNDAE